MSQQADPTEPRTKAGRGFHTTFHKGKCPVAYGAPCSALEDILAIEAEAADGAVSEAALEAIALHRANRAEAAQGAAPPSLYDAARAILPEVIDAELPSAITSDDPMAGIERMKAIGDRWERLRAALSEGAAPLDYSVPPEVANAEVEWGGREAAPRAEGQPLTDEERAEIRDWYDRLPEAVTPIYDEPRAEGLDAERLQEALTVLVNTAHRAYMGLGFDPKTQRDREERERLLMELEIATDRARAVLSRPSDERMEEE